MKKLFWYLLVFISLPLSTFATHHVAANAINALGIDLLRQTKADENTLLSPYSIQCAMAMAYEGADGTTRIEMAKVLHYPNDNQIRSSLGTLRDSLHRIAMNSLAIAEQNKKQFHVQSDPLVLTTANRMFGQIGYEFRPAFLSLLERSYAAPFEALDFRKAPSEAAKHINNWVEQQTHDRIRNLVSPDALNDLTRLVLVNGIFLKAPWSFPFPVEGTKPEQFHLFSQKLMNVPTMAQTEKFGYGKFNGITAVVLPYSPSDLQLLVLLPNNRAGLASLERTLSPDLLAKCATLKPKEIVLHLPKFKIEPPLFDLKNTFEKLGMKNAFDLPLGSANFDRIAAKRANAYLFISDIFHKTFVAVDENGTEAAAATVLPAELSMGVHTDKPKPIEVHVDHPFLFAIQHRETGACLFIGRVTDPSVN